MILLVILFLIKIFSWTNSFKFKTEHFSKTIYGSTGIYLLKINNGNKVNVWNVFNHLSANPLKCLTVLYHFLELALKVLKLEVRNVALLTQLNLASKISVLGSLIWSEQVRIIWLLNWIFLTQCEVYENVRCTRTTSISIADFWQVNVGSCSLFSWQNSTIDAGQGSEYASAGISL